MTKSSQLQLHDSQLAAIYNATLLTGLSSLWSNRFQLVESVHATDNLSKHDMFAIEMRGLYKAEEELRSVCIWSGVGHWQDSSSSVLVVEILVLKFGAVDAFAACSITSGEVSTLSHEAINDPVEFAAFEMKRLARLSCSLFSGTESTEVLRSFRGVFFELDFNSGACLAANCNVEEYFCHLLKDTFNKSIINHLTNLKDTKT